MGIVCWVCLGGWGLDFPNPGEVLVSILIGKGLEPALLEGQLLAVSWHSVDLLRVTPYLMLVSFTSFSSSAGWVVLHAGKDGQRWSLCTLC